MHSQSGIRIANTVNCALHLERLGAIVLHDVDLAAARPTDTVVAQHPEGRPDGLAGGNLNPSFDSAIGEVFAEAAVHLRLHARGEVGAAGKVGLDHQVAVDVEKRSGAIGDHVFNLAGNGNLVIKTYL